MYDSETESEPECDLKKWDATEFASQLPRALSEHLDRDLAERVTNAIATLGSIPVREVLMVGCQVFAPIMESDWILRLQDEKLHRSIEGAANAIFVFLNEFSAPELSMGAGQALKLKTLSLIGK